MFRSGAGTKDRPRTRAPSRTRRPAGIPLGTPFVARPGTRPRCRTPHAPPILPPRRGSLPPPTPRPAPSVLTPVRNRGSPCARRPGNGMPGCRLPVAGRELTGVPKPRPSRTSRPGRTMRYRGQHPGGTPLLRTPALPPYGPATRRSTTRRWTAPPSALRSGPCRRPHRSSRSRESTPPPLPHGGHLPRRRDRPVHPAPGRAAAVASAACGTSPPSPPPRVLPVRVLPALPTRRIASP